MYTLLNCYFDHVPTALNDFQLNLKLQCVRSLILLFDITDWVIVLVLQNYSVAFLRTPLIKIACILRAYNCFYSCVGIKSDVTANADAIKSGKRKVTPCGAWWLWRVIKLSNWRQLLVLIACIYVWKLIFSDFYERSSPLRLLPTPSNGEFLSSEFNLMHFHHWQLYLYVRVCMYIHMRQLQRIICLMKMNLYICRRHLWGTADASQERIKDWEILRVCNWNSLQISIFNAQEISLLNFNVNQMLSAPNVVKSFLNAYTQ